MGKVPTKTTALRWPLYPLSSKVIAKRSSSLLFYFTQAKGATAATTGQLHLIEYNIKMCNSRRVGRGILGHYPLIFKETTPPPPHPLNFLLA